MAAKLGINTDGAASISKEYAKMLLDLPDEMAGLARWYFRSFDANGDGELQFEEIQELVMQLFKDLTLSPPSADEVQLWLTTFDSNKNGTFSPKEFQRFFQSALRLAAEGDGEAGQATDAAVAADFMDMASPKKPPPAGGRVGAGDMQQFDSLVGKRMQYSNYKPFWLLLRPGDEQGSGSGLGTEKPVDSPGLLTSSEEVVVLGSAGLMLRVRTEAGIVGWVHGALLKELTTTAVADDLGYAVGDKVQVKTAKGWTDSEVLRINSDGTYDTLHKSGVYPRHVRAIRSDAPPVQSQIEQHDDGTSRPTISLASTSSSVKELEQELFWALQALQNVQTLDPQVFSRALNLSDVFNLSSPTGVTSPPAKSDAASIRRRLRTVGPGLLSAADELRAKVNALDTDALLNALLDLGLEEDAVPLARDELSDPAKLKEEKRLLYETLTVALPTTTLEAAIDVAASDRLKAFLQQRGISKYNGNLEALRQKSEPWRALWARIRLQHPTGKEALIPQRASKRILIIGPGFGLLATPHMFEMVRAAGYQTQVLTQLPDPQDLSRMEVQLQLRRIAYEIQQFKPHCVASASKGYSYMVELWKDPSFEIPCLMINCHPSIKELPRSCPVVVTHGTRDTTFPRIVECQAVHVWTEEARRALSDNVTYKSIRHAGDSPALIVTRSVCLRARVGGRLEETTVPAGAVLFSDTILKAASGADIYMHMQNKDDLEQLQVPATVYYRHGREDLEQVMETGDPGKAWLYLSASGYQFSKGQFMCVREGDNHAAPASLFQNDLLPRLLDATMSGRPEEYIHETWYDLIMARRREEEAYLGYDPQGLSRFWVSDGTGSQPSKAARSPQWRHPVQQGSREYQAVEWIFRSDPPGKLYNFGNNWSQVHVLGVDRVENLGQQQGTDSYYERVKNTFVQQGVDFVNGVHTRWLFHGSPAVAHIVADPISGFKPLLSTAALWGKGIYFARDAQYPDDHGIVFQDERGVREVLLCLVVTGMSIVGDPSYKLLPHRNGMAHRYNSFVDSLSNPEIFAVSLSSAALAAYVVRYT